MSLRVPLSHGTAHDVQVPLSASDDIEDTLDADLEQMIGEEYDDMGNPLTNFSGRTASGEIGAHREVTRPLEGYKGQTHLANPINPPSVPKPSSCVPQLGTFWNQNTLPDTLLMDMTQQGVPTDHRGGLPSQAQIRASARVRPSQYGPSTAKSSGYVNPPQPVVTPTKGLLESEVERLRYGLQMQSQACISQLESQRHGFEAAAQNYQQQTQDVTQAKVAQGEAITEARMQTALVQTQQVVERVQGRLQSQSQKAQQEKQLLEQQATDAIEMQRVALIKEANEALQAQQQTLISIHASQHANAQSQDALVEQAEQALLVQTLAEQSMEANAQQQLQTLWSEANESIQYHKQEQTNLASQLQQAQAQIEQLKVINSLAANAGGDLKKQVLRAESQAMQTQGEMTFLVDKAKAAEVHSDQQLVHANEIRREQEATRSVQFNDSMQLMKTEVMNAHAENEHLRALNSEQAAATAAATASKFEQMQQAMLTMQQEMQNMSEVKASAPQTFDMGTPREPGGSAPTAPSVILEGDEDEDSYITDEDDDPNEDWNAAPEEETQEPPKETKGPSAAGAAASLAPHQRKSRIKEADECKFPDFPTQNTLRGWKIRVNKIIIGASGRPKEAFLWIVMVLSAVTCQELAEACGFDTLDAKIAVGLMAILRGEFKRRIDLMDE